MAAAPPGPAKLGAALLGRSDLPAAYTRRMKSVDQWTDTPSTNFGDSCATDPVGDPGTGRTRVAVAAFARPPAGTATLLEMLAATGDKNARAAVAGTEVAARLCPPSVFVISGARETISYLPMRVPRLGDVAAGIRYQVRRPGSEAIVQYWRVVVVAVHGVYASVSLSGTSDPDLAELTRIATTAVQKIKRTP